MTKETPEIILEMVRQLVAASFPRKVILFGSYAKGTEHADSDIDFLVIETTVPSRHNEMVRLRRVLRAFHVPIDILVVSEAEFLDRSSSPSNVYYWANKEGRVLYEAA